MRKLYMLFLAISLASLELLAQGHKCTYEWLYPPTGKIGVDVFCIRTKRL